MNFPVLRKMPPPGLQPVFSGIFNLVFRKSGILSFSRVVDPQAGGQLS